MDSGPVFSGLSYQEAKHQVLDSFTREFVRRLLQVSKGSVSQAAREAKMDSANIKAAERRDKAMKSAEATGKGVEERITAAFNKALEKQKAEEGDQGPQPVMVTNPDQLADANAKKLKGDKEKDFDMKFLTRNFIPVRQ